MLLGGMTGETITNAGLYAKAPFTLGVAAASGPNYQNSGQQATYDAAVNQFVTDMGVKPKYFDTAIDSTEQITTWASNSATWEATSDAGSSSLAGMFPTIALPMASTYAGDPTYDQAFQNWANGTYDFMIYGMVQAYAVTGGYKTQIWRVGVEMNLTGGRSSPDGSAQMDSDWVRAFQHIYVMLHKAGQLYGVNIQVMWNPGCSNWGTTITPLQALYPGNQYVDIIGADVYADMFPGTPPIYDWAANGQVYGVSSPVTDATLNAWAANPINLRHYYDYPASYQWGEDNSGGRAVSMQMVIDLAKKMGKPFAIAETGAGDTSHDGLNLLDNATFPAWEAAMLLNNKITPVYVLMWDSMRAATISGARRLNSKPLEKAAWIAGFGATASTTPTNPLAYTTSGQGTGAVLNGTFASNALTSVVPASVGSNCANGDILQATGGSVPSGNGPALTQAKFLISNVSGGSIPSNGFAVSLAGSYGTPPAGPVTLTPTGASTCTGATVNIGSWTKPGGSLTMQNLDIIANGAGVSPVTAQFGTTSRSTDIENIVLQSSGTNYFSGGFDLTGVQNGIFNHVNGQNNQSYLTSNPGAGSLRYAREFISSGAQCASLE